MYLLLRVIGATVGRESERISTLRERTHKRTMARRVAGTEPRRGARGPLRPARARAEGGPRRLRGWRRGQRRGLRPRGADQDHGQPSARSGDIFGDGQMLVVRTPECRADSLGQFVGTEHSIGLYNLALAVDPLGLYRIEPRTLLWQ